MSSANSGSDEKERGEDTLVNIHRRLWYYILAVFAIIMLTIWNESMELLNSMENDRNLWSFTAVFVSISMSGLPLFVALFGILTFETKFAFSAKLLWKKIVPITVIACAFWWIVAALLHMKSNYANEEDFSTLFQCLSEVLETPANIRFCHLVCSAFIFYPLLRKLYQTPRISKYFLIVLGLFTVVEPIIKMIPFFQPITLFIDQINWGFFRAWAFYLTLGVYVNQININWKTRLVIYCFGILSIGLAYWVTSIAMSGKNESLFDLLEFSSPLAAFQAFTIMVFARYHFDCTGKPEKGSLMRSIDLSGIWSCVPLIFLAESITDLLPLPEDSRILLFLMRIPIIILIVMLFYFVFSKLAGFRQILGIYNRYAGGVKK